MGKRIYKLKRKILRLARKKPLFFFGGLGLAAIALVAVLLVLALPGGKNPTSPADSTDKTVIKIVAGGDLNITDRTVVAGEIGGGYDYTDVFLDVAEIFAQAQAAVLNLEGTLCGSPYGSATASAPQALAQTLSDCGVDFLQTANSCSVKNGILGLKETLSAVRNAGMEPLGTFADSSDFSKNQGFTLREIGGIRVAFVAFTKGMDGMGLPAGSEKCVNLLYTDYTTTYKKVNTAGITAVLDAVNAATPDVTIALLHWGSEGSTTISPTQKKIVRLLQQNGVDAIIGTHSHQVQPIVFDEEKGTLVAYSLGDFFGDATTSGTQYSVLLEVEITKDNLTGNTAVTGFNPIPLYTLTPERDGTEMKVMQIQSALRQYEENHISAVSDTTYENMKAALSKIEKQLLPPEK